MEQLGIDFNATGSVMSKSELEELRRKRGECITCGRKCFQKRLFKMIPITDHGRVLNGRCLNCKPLDATENEGGLIPAVSRPATKEDLARFSRSQSNLGLSGPGVRSPSRRQSGRSYSGIDTSSRGAAPSPGRAPSRTASLSLSHVANQHAESSRGRSSELENSASRINPSATSRDRSITPSRAQRHTGSSSAHLHADLEASTSVDSRQGSHRHIPAGFDLTSAHSLDRRDLSDACGDALDMRSGLHDKGRLDDLHDSVDYGYPDDQSVHANRAESHPASQMDCCNPNSQRSFGAMNHTSEPPQAPRRSVSRQHSDDDSHLGHRLGMLDRGGEFSFVNNPQEQLQRDRVNNSNIPIPAGTNSVRHIGSNRTLSSMSSIEEDLVNGRMNSKKRFVARSHSVDLYEEEPIDINTMRTRTAADERAIDRLHAANGNCAEILTVMRDFIGSTIVQSYSLKELSCLHLGPEDQDRLAHHGAMDVIAESMHSYPDNIELQIHGCRAVWNGSGTTENQIAFVNAGALDIILSDMDRFIDIAEVQECAMGTLSNLAAAEPNLLKMIEKGTVGRIVEAMNKHSENNLVQAKGCSAITNMASHLSPLKKDIMDRGGGGAVVICMVMHPDDFNLQEKALRALKNLSSNNDENKVELANIGGIDAVITAMQVHRDQPGVQEAGAWTLSNLASNNDNKAVIGDCGGIDVVIRAMWVHSGNVKVQECSCRALYSLTLDRHNSGMVLQVGGISAVVNAMQAHVDSGTVQEMGCAVLCNLAFDESSKMRIVDEEALDAIVLAMVLYSEDAKVQESACEVLLQLAIVENFKSMQASNIGELASAAAAKFPENCKEPALKLLSVLEGYCEHY